jgi:hypothetical protein
VEQTQTRMTNWSALVPATVGIPLAAFGQEAIGDLVSVRV